MFVFFEDLNDFKIGKILSRTESTIQVESTKNKKLKVKKNNVLFEFNNIRNNNDILCDDILLHASNIAEKLDPNFLWEFLKLEEFNAIDLAIEYFGKNITTIEKMSIFIFLHKNPIYFYKKRPGVYYPANAENIKQGLLSLEKKKQYIKKIEDISNSMINGILPDEIKSSLDNLISLPDKNSIQWKSLDRACSLLKTSPEKLLISLNAWPNNLIMHKRSFLGANSCYENIQNNFPKIVTDFEYPTTLHEDIYSIDDSNTTEIDDALSVKILENGNIKIGIHIAAPGISIIKNSEYDQIARAKCSTIYLPGEKITMLPENLIKIFSLDEGKLVPSLSLYITFNKENHKIEETFSCIEKIIVKKNLRIKEIEHIFNIDDLNDDVLLPYNTWVKSLWKISKTLSKKREEIRGKPENHSRQEYDFVLNGDPNDNNTKIDIKKRMRHSPINMIVSEFMILANTIWGKFLYNHEIPAIYRYQQYGKAKMSTYSMPHEGIGVSQYVWSTSPLRRYIDLVNQWQIISIIKHGITSKLFSPFKHNDSDLFSIISLFESQYKEILNFQNKIEKFWCIKWLEQNQIKKIQAEVIRDKFIRFLDLPIVLKLNELPNLKPGDLIEIEIMNTDETSLNIECRFNK